LVTNTHCLMSNFLHTTFGLFDSHESNKHDSKNDVAAFSS